MHCLDRAHDTSFKSKAFVRALDVVRGLPPEDVESRAAAHTLTQLDGIGDSSARVIEEAIAGANTYLAELEARTQVPITEAGRRYREALRGDLHMHSRWSDGGATIESMVRTAIEQGHDYIVITDHSPRLTVAHGLDAERLRQQIDDIAVLNERFAPFRIFTGIEVDILEDGTLDHPDHTLAELDLVIASVHSKLKMPEQQMTERMVRAVANPHVDVLGHCTGRMIGKRDPSQFDPDYVFAACATFHTAVEINCRPERLDPPRPLLAMAIEHGCHFTIDTDAHATGQLEWLPKGCDRAAETGVPLDRVLNSWTADELMAWVAAT